LRNLNHLHPDFINVYTSTVSNFDGGAEYTIKELSVRCRVEPISRAEELIAGRPAVLKLFRVFCNSNIDIDTTDIIEFNSKNYNIEDKNIYPNSYMELLISEIK